MNYLTFVWRVIRPHVYSFNQYAALVERDPGELTVGEMRTITTNKINADIAFNG